MSMCQLCIAIIKRAATGGISRFSGFCRNGIEKLAVIRWETLKIRPRWMCFGLKLEYFSFSLKFADCCERAIIRRAADNCGIFVRRKKCTRAEFALFLLFDYLLDEGYGPDNGFRIYHKFLRMARYRAYSRSHAFYENVKKALWEKNGLDSTCRDQAGNFFAI